MIKCLSVMFMKSITVRTIKYQIIKDYRDAVDKEAITDNLTDYFDDYDYSDKFNIEEFEKNFDDYNYDGETTTEINPN